MCAVVGMCALNESTFTEEEVHFFEELLQQSKIRGLHATGISYVESSRVITIKDSKPADKFLEDHPLTFLLGKRAMIGHCRYSTSDLEYNQPIADDELSIVHNGVVTQEDPKNWDEHFHMECATKNDSEIFFNILKAEQQPFRSIPDASGSVLVLTNTEQLRVFRNGKRPLWSASNKDMIFFGSTKDILQRTIMKTGYCTLTIKKMELGVIYKYSPRLQEEMQDFDGEEWQ